MFTGNHLSNVHSPGRGKACAAFGADPLPGLAVVVCRSARGAIARHAPIGSQLAVLVLAKSRRMESVDGSRVILHPAQATMVSDAVAVRVVNMVRATAQRTFNGNVLHHAVTLSSMGTA